MPKHPGLILERISDAANEHTPKTETEEVSLEKDMHCDKKEPPKTGLKERMLCARAECPQNPSAVPGLKERLASFQKMIDAFRTVAL